MNRLDVARQMATDDDVEALLIAAVFSREMGKDEQAETFFARAALKDPSATKTAREELAP
jgi:hypothetical protein